MVVVAVLVIAPRAQAAADQFVQAATVTSANGVAGDFTGGSVAISADGSTMVVGVPEANSRQGEAYVYTRGANGWQNANQPAVLSASNGVADDEFGDSVSVSQDGSVVAVGAPYASAGGSDRGGVYVFNRPAGGWAPQSAQAETPSAAGPADFDRLGSAVALSPDGTYLAAGATGYSSSVSLTGQGGVYVWSYSGSALSTVGTEPLVASDAANEDGLGWSVAMPSDSLIYAGAPYHPGNDGPGAVYGFSSESSFEVGYTPWAHVSQAELSAAGSSLFGASVAAAGGIVAAGAPDTTSDEGNVYLFEPGFGCVTELFHGCFKPTTYTAPLATLSYPSGAGKLGYAVALTGDGSAVLAGAPGYAASPPQPAGAAYVFQAPSGGWASATQPNATLQSADSTADDDFGWAVALSADGGALAVGNPSGDAATAGEADVFEGRTGTSVSCQPGTVGVGEPTTCTVKVTDDGIGEATPTGTVGFATDSAGSFSASKCTLSAMAMATGTSSCHVTYTPSAADSGAHVVTVQYAGDDEHAPGTGQTTIAINRLTTSTAVSCSPSPVTVGEAADCTATVTASDASAGPPTGTVMFTTNGPGTFSGTACTLPAGSGTTASCTSSYTPSAIGPGTHQLTAAYAGDGGHAASEGSDPLGVAEASTRITVGCVPLSVAAGKTTQCTATVTDAGSGGFAPTGGVTATSTGAGTLSSCTLAIQESAVAACTFSYTPANAATPSPRLTATYDGDADHFASSASALLNVSPTGSPVVTLGRVSIRGGRIVFTLTCPKTEAYCKVKVTIKVGSRTLAAGSATVAGGSIKALALAPKAAVLRRLRAGRHAAKIAVVAVDQSGHRKRASLAARLSTGKHFKLVTLVIRK